MPQRAGLALAAGVVVVLLAALLVTFISSSGPEYAFDVEHVLEVDIGIDPDEWVELRHQHRCHFGAFASDECTTSPFPSPYTWKTATVTVDGLSLVNVAVRKKGYGSTYVMDRPGLKIRFDKHVRRQRWMDLRRLTLNTTHDPVRTCLAYEVLRDAGVPTPRCAFANVRVNGAALGVYAVVESIDRAFIERHFDSADGPLFEGIVNDFRLDHRPIFERKNDNGGTGQHSIDRLTKALAVDDPDALSEVADLVDLDAFLDLWAAEVLIARWDGYAGHMNNFFLYRDPNSERLHFIPWGGNRATFQSLRNPVLSPPNETMPESVIAHGQLARRLYTSEVGRDRYVRRLRSLLNTTWNTSRLLERIDRMEATLAGYPGEREPSDQIRSFVRTRRRVIEDELNAGPPPWPFDAPRSTCMVPAGAVSGSFSTIFTSSTAHALERSGPAHLEITLDDSKLDIRRVTASAGWLTLKDAPIPLPLSAEGAASIALTAELPSRRLDLTVAVPFELFTTKNTVAFGNPEPGCRSGGPPFGIVCVEAAVPCLQPAFVSHGVLTLDEAVAREGATIRGRFTARLMRHPWGLFEGHPSIWRDGAPHRSWIERETAAPSKGF